MWHVDGYRLLSVKLTFLIFFSLYDTSNFVKNTRLRVVFSTLVSVFGYSDETLSLVFDFFGLQKVDHYPKCLTSASANEKGIMFLKEKRSLYGSQFPITWNAQRSRHAMIVELN